MAPRKKLPDGINDSAMRRSSSRAFERQEKPPMFPPVNRAAMDNAVGKMSQLLDAGANIEERDHDDGATPLIGACRYNNTLTALELIRRGADVNAVTTRGASTAIGWAAVNGMTDVARELILKGCSLNVEVNGRKTIQHYVRDYKGTQSDFYKMIEETLDELERRRAAAAQAEAERLAEAYSNGATVLRQPMTVAKPITLKR